VNWSGQDGQSARGFTKHIVYLGVRSVQTRLIMVRYIHRKAASGFIYAQKLTTRLTSFAWPVKKVEEGLV